MPFKKMGVAAVDYSGFGEYGARLQALFEAIWTIATEYWNERYSQRFRMSFDEAFNVLDRANEWLVELIVTSNRPYGFLDARSMPDFWSMFREIFCPPFREHHNWTYERLGTSALCAGLFAREMYARAREDQRVFLAHAETTRICYGPFRQDEMAYLLRHHPKIIEIGGGSGYFASVFSRAGGTITSYDNDTYQWNREPPPWLFGLKRAGILAEGGAEAATRHPDRTLLISWPQGGSVFPFEALRRYRRAGGRRFAFKLGGFMGRATTNLLGGIILPPAQAALNHKRFFKELLRYWRETDDADRPEHVPEAFLNNLWMFECKQ